MILEQIFNYKFENRAIRTAHGRAEQRPKTNNVGNSAEVILSIFHDENKIFEY